MFAKKIIIGLVFLLSTFNLYSQELDFTTLSKKEIYKFIDKSIDEKDKELLSFISILTPDFPDYTKIDEYLLEKIEGLIVSGDLKYPLLLVEGVLYNDLENTKAQELYIIIINKNIETEDRTVLEEEHVEVIKEDIVALAADAAVQFEVQETQADYIISDIELLTTIQGYSNNYIRRHYFSTFHIYPFSTNYYSSEVYDGYIDRNEHTNSFPAFGLDVGGGMNIGKLTCRFDFLGSIASSDIRTENQKQVRGGGFFSTGITNIYVPLFLRGGFLYDLYQYNSNVFSDVAITNLPTPTVGLGILDLKFGKVLKLDATADYILASTYTNNLTYGIFNRVYLTLNLFRYLNRNFEIKGGFDSLYLMEDGLSEFSITPKIGFGVSRYE